MANTQPPRFRRPIVVGVLVSACSLVGAAAPPEQGGGLADRVAALEATVSSLTQQVAALGMGVTIDVHCGTGATIQAALLGVQHHPAAVRINVFGVCSENVRISRNNVQIRAGAPGAGITAAIPFQPVIRTEPFGLGLRLLTLVGLTISGGNNGVLLDYGSQAQLVDCIVTNNSGAGIQVARQSIVRLENVVAEANGGPGVSAATGSLAVINGGTVRNNTSDGVALFNATAEIGNSVVIASNGRYGISPSNHSVLSLNAATVTANAITGVFVSGGSHVSLGAGASITANTGSGISLMDTSIVHKHRSLADIHITNNGAWGIVCSVPPAVAQIVGFTFQTGDISGNPSGNINCPISPGPLAQ